jgi:hypothetical protein
MGYKFASLILNINLMKNFILFFGLLFLSISLNAQESIEGIWDTGQDNTKIVIINSSGKIHSSDNEKVIIGKLLVKELKKIDNSWKGKLYLIKRNKWVDAIFVHKGNFLNVTISSGWQSKTLKWTKVK